MSTLNELKYNVYNRFSGRKNLSYDDLRKAYPGEKNDAAKAIALFGLPENQAMYQWLNPVNDGFDLLEKLGDRASVFIPGAMESDGSHSVPGASLNPTVGTQVLGPNLITAAGWSTTPGVTNNSGTLTLSGATTTLAAQQAGVKAGVTYLVTGTVSGLTAGSLSLTLEGGTATTPTLSANGNFSSVLTATATGLLFVYLRSTPVTAVVSNIGLQEITTMPQAAWLMDYVEPSMATPAVVDGPVGALTDGSGTAGPEISGGLTTPANWVVSGGASIASGVLALPAATSQAASSVSVVANQTYRVTFTVSNATAGLFLNVYVGSTQVSGVVIGANNSTISRNITATSTSGLLIQNDPGSTGSCSISNVSIRQLTGRHATQGTGANKPVLRRGLVNKVLQSATLGTGWSNNGGGSASSNTAAGLDGSTLDASTVTCTGTSGSGVYAAGTGIASGTPTTMFAYVRRVSGASIRAMIGGDITNIWVKFNPQTMAISSVGTGVTASSVQAMSGGYYLFVWSGAPTTTNSSFVVYNDDTSPLTLAVANTGAFEGTYTAAQILACGAAKTTTTPASSPRGNYSLTLNGADQYLALSSVPLKDFQDSVVIAGAQSPNTTVGREDIFAVRNTQQNPAIGFELGFLSGAPQARLRNDAAQGPLLQHGAAIVGTPVVMACRLVSGNAQLRVNGANSGAAQLVSGAVTVDLATIGAGTTGSAGSIADFARGPIYIVVIVRGTLTDAELLVLERFVAALTGPTGITI